MRTLLLAAVAVAALGSASAYAGEGNGPSYPGLQAVSTGVTTSFVDPAVSQTPTTTLLSSANATFQTANSAPRRRPGHGSTQAQRMIATLSGVVAG